MRPKQKIQMSLASLKTPVHYDLLSHLYYNPLLSLKLLKYLYKKKYDFHIDFCPYLVFNNELNLLKYCMKKIKKHRNFNGSLYETELIYTVCKDDHHNTLNEKMKKYISRLYSHACK